MTTPKRIHKWIGPTGRTFIDVRHKSGTYYPASTDPKLLTELERARVHGLRIRLFYGDSKTGRDWGEEFDVTGQIGRSMGPIHIPILLHNTRSTGGGAILVTSIVRLFVGGREVYRHPNYSQAEYTIRWPSVSRDKGYTHDVRADKKIVASFTSREAAIRWIDFITGKRLGR